MKKLIARIKKKMAKRAARPHLTQWYSDFRYQRAAKQEEILAALKKSETLPSSTILQQNDLVKIILQTDKILSICLGIYAISKLNSVHRATTLQLIQLLAHEEETVRRLSALTLTKMGTVETLSAVVAGNNHGHGIRTQAAWKLKELGPKAAAAIPSLLKLIAYKDINFRTHYVAADALASIGNPAKKILLEQLDSKNENLRFYAAYALSILEPERYINLKIRSILDAEPQ